MSETKKVSKKERAKKRNMRNTVIMAVLCVALLSSATYAWFTLSDSARINNLTLTVGEVSGLMIAEETSAGKPGTYGSEINLTALTNATGKLMPATLAKLDGAANYAVVKPDYKDSDIGIEGLVALTDGETMNDSNASSSTGNYYCYEKVFYMKSEGAAADVYLVGSAVDGTGTYVKDTDPQADPAYPAAWSMRIAFFETDSTGSTETLLAVYEPNSDQTFGDRTDKVLDADISYGTATLWSADEAADAASTVGANLQQTLAGTFVNGTGNTSEKLFSLTADTDHRIVMRVYFAGEDNDCCNIISANKIAGQLKFTTTEGTN